MSGTREIAKLVHLAGYMEISSHEIYRLFRQPNRETPLGQYLTTLADIPDPKQNHDSWLRANEIDELYDLTRDVYLWVSKEMPRGAMLVPNSEQHAAHGTVTKCEHVRNHTAGHREPAQ